MPFAAAAASMDQIADHRPVDPESAPTLPAPRPLAPMEVETLSVPQILQRIDAGVMHGAGLSPLDRQECVWALTLEGQTNGEIAQALRISDRTVQRDRAELHRRHALAPRMDLGDELLGEMQQRTQASVQRLTRMSRDPAIPPYVRVWADQATIRTYQRFIETTHKLRYFEDGAGRIRRQCVSEANALERERQIAAAIAIRDDTDLTSILPPKSKSPRKGGKASSY